MIRICILLLVASILAPPGRSAESGRRRSRGQRHYSAPRTRYKSTAREQFRRDHPCPSTGKRSGGCAGYTIRRDQPWKRGDRDDPRSMRWEPR